MLEVSGLSLTLAGGKTLLSNIAFAAEPGELIAVLGENGAGKSTLLHQVADARQNAISLDERPLPHWQPLMLARRRAFLGQQPASPGAMTGRQLVTLGRAPFEESAQASAVACHHWLSRCRCQGLAERPLAELSGGQLARLHLARVLCQLHGVSRPVLLLDEPTAALDLAAQHQLLAEVKALCRQGALVLWVVHDLNLACQYASRLLLLKAGKLLADLPPTELTPALASRLYNHPMQSIPLPGLAAPLWQAKTGVPLDA